MSGKAAYRIHCLKGNMGLCTGCGAVLNTREVVTKSDETGLPKRATVTMYCAYDSSYQTESSSSKPKPGRHSFFTWEEKLSRRDAKRLQERDLYHQKKR
jgi:hypothetical protein